MNTNSTLERQTPKAFGVEQPTILTRVQRLFAAPIFEDDEEKTRVAHLLNIVLLSVMAVAALMLPLTLVIYGLPNSLEEAFMPLSSAVTLVTMAGLLIFARRGHLQITSGILLALIWMLITFWLHGFSKASSDSNNAMYILVVVLSGLLLDRRAAIFFTALSLLSIGIAFYPEIRQTGQEALVFDLLIKLIVIGLTGLLLGYAVNNMTKALDLVRRSEHAIAERNREMEASQRVTSAASERVSPTELMGLVADLIRDQFDLYHVQVYIVDEKQETAVLRESTGYAGQQLLQEKHHIPLDHPALVTQSIREGQPVLVDDVSQVPNFMPNPLLPDTKSELVVPLRAGDRVIGVLDVQDRVPGRFTASTVTLFQTMTDQLTFLFENSELWERVSEQTQALSASANQLRAAAEIAEQVSTILDPERLLHQVVELLQSRFGLYHAHIYLCDEAAERLTVRAGSGEVGRVLQERGHSIPLDREKSLVARAARERAAVLVDDTSAEAGFMPNPLLPQTRSEAAVPLIAGGKVLGVLDVQDDQPGRFTSTDLDTFSTLAGQIATALQNAGLFEQVEHSLAETKARFEVSQVLAGAQTEDDVLDAMIQIADLYAQTRLSIFTFDPEAEESTLVLRRIEAFEGGIAAGVEPGTSFPASMFPLLNLMSADESFVSPNLIEDERADPASHQIIRQSGGVSAAVLPISTGNEWMGIIAVSSPQEGYFDEHKLYLYQSLAEQSATALHTARLRDATQESERQYRELLGSLRDGFAVVDMEGNIVQCNVAFEKITGYTLEELKQITFTDLTPEKWHAIEGEILEKQVLARGYSDLYQKEYIHKNGTIFPVELAVYLVKDREGNPAGFWGFIRDISERRQAQAERERFTTQLRTAADLAEQINNILDPDRLLPEVVSQLHDRFGLYHVHIYLLDELTGELAMRAGSGEVGQILFEQGHSIALERKQSLVARAARTREIVSVADTSLEAGFMPNPLLPETRSEVAVPLVAGDKVLGVLDVQDNQPQRFTPADLNVFSTLAGQIATALQNAGLFEQVERSLAETQARFEVSQVLAGAQTEDDVLEAMIQAANFYSEARVSIFMIVPEMDECTFVHSRSFDAGSEAPSLPLGTQFAAAQFPLIQYISPETPFVSSNVALDEQIDPADREVLSEMEFASVAALPITAGDEWLGVIAVSSLQEGYFDEHKLYLYQSLAEQGAIALRTARLYDETQRTAQRLRQVDRLKSEFLANMSHELRTPLNSILGYTELILMDLEDELDAETLQDIQAIHNNGQHLLSLINDILDLAKIEAGRMTLNLEQVPIEPLLDGIKNSSAGLLVKKSIDFKVMVEDDLPTVQADPVRLHQILNNLVSNAVKFTDEGHVSLHAFRQPDGAGSDNGWVCIEIKDTGVGISQEDLEAIFDKFQQVDGSFTRRAEGTGLGLSITRHLVQMHGGTIDVQSQPGQGSTFTVRLPTQHQQQAAVTTTDGKT